MGRVLGRKRRAPDTPARLLGYEVEVRDEWEHVCKPPMTEGRVLRPVPKLWNGDTAAEGTRWRCKECKTLWEVYCPDERSPGIRAWAEIEEGPDTGH